MVLINIPYVSRFLTDTLKDHNIPVIKTDEAVSVLPAEGINFIPESEAKEKLLKQESRLYSVSENSIEWISEHLSGCGVMEKINLFKDKYAFRKMISGMYPDFFYDEISVGELDNYPEESLVYPFVIKPVIGFFSVGVYTVNTPEEWTMVKEAIKSDLKDISRNYPEVVVNSSRFIIEEYINGEEYAIDSYFNTDGEAVVLGIYRHIFASGDDVRDRVYMTSPEIIREHLDDFTKFTAQIGELTGLKNFPIHIELRIDAKGRINPIEVNPLRFGGWCTTADNTFHAYGFNPYLYYFENRKPDWESLLAGKEGMYFCLIVLDNSTGIPMEEIESFDYDKVAARFNNVIKVRKIDHKKFPLFGFLMVETDDLHFEEIEYILYSDLREFVR